MRSAAGETRERRVSRSRGAPGASGQLSAVSDQRELAIDEVPAGLTPQWWVWNCEHLAKVTIPENAERIEELKQRAAAVSRRYGIGKKS